MSRKKRNAKDSQSEDCGQYQDKLKAANLKIRALKRHLRSVERELSRLNKQIATGKLVSYGEQEEIEEIKEEFISPNRCPNCGYPEPIITKFELRDCVKELTKCPDCGYQNMKRTNIRTP